MAITYVPALSGGKVTLHSLIKVFFGGVLCVLIQEVAGLKLAGTSSYLGPLFPC